MTLFLIAVGAILVILNFKAAKKENKSFKDMVKHSEDSMTDFDVAIGEVRKEFAETILELQQEAYSLRELIDLQNKEINSLKTTVGSLKEDLIYNSKEEISKSINEKLVNSIEDTKEEDIVERELSVGEELKIKDLSDVAENKTEEIEVVQITPEHEEESNSKVKEIGELLKQGISLDHICEKYSIGKGEVLLIKELYLR